VISFPAPRSRAFRLTQSHKIGRFVGVVVNRRQLLAVGAVALTGCVGQSEEEPSKQTPSENEENVPPNEPSNEGDETADRPTPNAEVVRTDIIEAESVFGKIPWLIFEIANDTDALHGRVETETKFYDADGNILSTRSARSELIPSRGVWRQYHRYAQEDRDEVERAEVEILQAQEPPQMQVVEGVEVYNTNLEANPEDVVRVTGELNPPAQQADNVLVLLYDGEGRFRGTVLQPTTGTAFEAGTVARRTPPDRSQISDYEILIVRYI